MIIIFTEFVDARFVFRNARLQSNISPPTYFPSTLPYGLEGKMSKQICGITCFHMLPRGRQTTMSESSGYTPIGNKHLSPLPLFSLLKTVQLKKRHNTKI